MWWKQEDWGSFIVRSCHSNSPGIAWVWDGERHHKVFDMLINSLSLQGLSGVPLLTSSDDKSIYPMRLVVKCCFKQVIQLNIFFLVIVKGTNNLQVVNSANVVSCYVLSVVDLCGLIWCFPRQAKNNRLETWTWLRHNWHFLQKM